MDILKLNATKENGIPTRQLATMLGIDSDTVRDLEDRGLLSSETISGKKYFPLIPSVQEYCSYLRLQNKGIAEDVPDELRKLKAEADLKEAKAAIEQMKKSELEATMHRSDDVERIITDLCMAVRAELLALPGMLAVDVASAQSASEAAGLIKKAVNDILNSLTDYSYNREDFKKLVREREKWMNEETNKEAGENNE